MLYEIGQADMARGSAGWAARADDAATVLTNPAGIGQLQGTRVEAGAQLTYGQVEFAADAQTSPDLGSDNGGNAVGALPAGSVFVTHEISERFAVGFGSGSYFGLAESYDEGWVGRYYAQEAALIGLSFIPAASFQVSDMLSVGAGLNLMYGYMNTEVAVRTLLTPGDGRLSVSDETWGVGANLGLLLVPRAGTRVGLTYFSPVDLDFSATPEFSNLGPIGGTIFDNPRELDLGLTVPQSLMLSVYESLSPDWALLANLGWQNWERFGRVDVGVDAANPQSLTTSLNYHDTWHAALGMDYRASEAWLLSAGVAYDSSAVDDADRSVTLPMGEAYRLGLGANWSLSPTVDLGFAYTFIWSGDMAVNQTSPFRGDLSGAFEDVWFSFVSITGRWQF